MVRRVEVRFRCLVFTSGRRACFHPYCRRNLPSDNGDQFFHITVVEKNWFFDGTSFVHTGSFRRLFNIPKSSIERGIYAMLSIFDVRPDLQGSTAAMILNSAANIANNTHKDEKYLHMRVDLLVARARHSTVRDDETYDQAVQESLEEDIYALVPASESSVERLEKVAKLEEDERLSDCSICLEGLEDNKEVIRMPCSHPFHGACIVHWLQQNNVCPLCRFQLPKANDVAR